MTHRKTTTEAHCARIAALAALLAAAPLVAQAGGVYRWVDDNGDVHYSDQMPARAMDKGHAVLDRQGVVRQRVTAESQGASRPDPAQEAAREAAAQRRHRDQVLLDTFTTTRDIKITRDQRLDGIDARIRLVERKLAQLQQQHSDARARLKQLPKDAAARKQAKATIDALEQRLSKQRDRLQQIRHHREQMAEQFAQDLERFRELKARDSSTD